MKNLFFKADESAKEAPKASFSVSDSIPIFDSTSTQVNFVEPKKSIDSEKMNSLRNLYEEEFKKLDLPGIDYYEFHKGVVNSGNITAESIKMMLSLIKGMSPSINKTILIEQSVKVLTVLTEFKSNIEAKGNEALRKIEMEASSEKIKLEDEKRQLEEHIRNLQSKLQMVQSKIGSFDSNILQKIESVTENVNASNLVHGEITSQIQQITTLLHGTV